MSANRYHLEPGWLARDLASAAEQAKNLRIAHTGTLFGLPVIVNEGDPPDTVAIVQNGKVVAAIRAEGEKG